MTLYLIAYLCVVIFLAAVAYRGYRAMSMPMHVRWEVYPVAHEKGKAYYGGSYYEELNWWTKPRPKSMVGEISAMGAEILLLKGVWEANRRLWWRSYPFHLGLYLLVGFVGLLVLGGILQVAGICPADGSCPVGTAIDGLTRIFGYFGLILTTLGTVLLLVWRLTDEDIRPYTKVSHIVNLLVILAAVGVALIAVIAESTGFGAMRSFIGGMITFGPNPAQGTLIGAAILLGCLLIAYIPLTHMAHFFLKYFTWHQVRWNDEPNLPGGRLEGEITELLGRPVTWSAPHIGADGKKTWGEVATSDMPSEKKDEKKK